MRKVTRREVLAAAVPAAGVAAVLVGAGAAGAYQKNGNIDQPHMGAALDALRTARKELDLAVADKGGHRAKAIGLVNNAIGEVEKGIQFDRKH
jgi:hypothetical protein